LCRSAQKTPALVEALPRNSQNSGFSLINFLTLLSPKKLPDCDKKHAGEAVMVLCSRISASEVAL
jgi:hypothetical protein